MSEGKSLFDDLMNPDVITNDVSTDVEEHQDDIEDTVDDADESSEEQEDSKDDRAIALYEFLKEQQLYNPSEEEEFSGRPEDLMQIMDQLPEEMFYRAVETLPDTTQDLIAYAFELGEEGSADKLKQFFDKYVSTPAIEKIETEEQAEEYLINKVKGNKLIKDPKKYIDELLEEGKLLETAQELFSEESKQYEADRKKQVEEAKAARAKQEEQVKQFYQNIYNEVQELEWKDERKSVVLENLLPDTLNRKSQVIMQNPKALIQLADFYSRFNEETGEFDLTDLETKTKSKKIQKSKDELMKDRASSILNKVSSKGKRTESTKQSFWSHFDKIN